MNKRIDMITDIRGFNRFYTNILGLLNANIVDSEYSLTEARIIYEISKTEHCTANLLSKELQIDAGYLSRTIKKLEQKGMIERHSSKKDGRSNKIGLTADGEILFRQMNEHANQQIDHLLKTLPDDKCKEISDAMKLIKKYFMIAMNDINIRMYNHDDSDIEYMIDRQLSLYESERNFNSEIWKKYLVEGVMTLVENFDQEKDAIFMLECNEVKSGCVAITHVDQKTAQLRYFFLEPELRGIGAGKKLLDEAISFCKEKKYEHVFLWTVSAQETARHLYGNAGFAITEKHENSQWGVPVLEERWDLEMSC